MKTIVLMLLLVAVVCFVLGLVFWSSTASSLSASASLLALLIAVISDN